MGHKILVRLRNLWHWRTAWAVRYLSKQLQRDPGFRQSWQANIAMPIYDATRPRCDCVACGCPVTHEHCTIHCPMSKVPNCWMLFMPLDQCNAIADKLMKHLFNA